MKRKVKRLLKEAYGRLFGQGAEKETRAAGLAARRVKELRTGAGERRMNDRRELNEEWALDSRRLLF
ncbi:hypothetical protein CDO73_19530 [Saccharibacillus sp. O23]|uniref:hypothetical protein n=1 Tax=Saccharibacillus sp. O23 TaxID=2009338 RepID=UPI000B4E408E|nr:hypothetical protein [Saccharibacillus sp. O23]OWR28080.1 hypothetical protein CDO73_19530 [Saccharibacillus sp. O23]